MSKILWALVLLSCFNYIGCTSQAEIEERERIAAEQREQERIAEEKRQQEEEQRRLEAERKRLESEQDQKLSRDVEWILNYTLQNGFNPAENKIKPAEENQSQSTEQQQK